MTSLEEVRKRATYDELDPMRNRHMRERRELAVKHTEEMKDLLLRQEQEAAHRRKGRDG